MDRTYSQSNGSIVWILGVRNVVLFTWVIARSQHEGVKHFMTECTSLLHFQESEI